MAVLNEQVEIACLPDDRLNAFPCEGPIVEGQISGKILLKIVRLQTLIMKSREDTRMPDDETIKQIVEESSSDPMIVCAKALAVSEDSTYRVMMLERLITEIVREHFPKECGQFRYNYFVRPDRKIVRVPIVELRFLD